MSKSRKKRKRDRQRAEATTESQNSIGWGQGVPIGRRDIAIIRKALRGDWEIPAEVRKAIFSDLKQLVIDVLALPEAERDPDLELTTVRLVVEMEGMNQHLEHASLPPCWPTDQI